MDPEEIQDLFTTVELTLDDGRTIAVQALDVEPTDVVLEGLTARFSDIAQTIRDISRTTRDAVAAARPTEATLEFGVDVAVKAGAVTALFANGGSKATLKVTLKWVFDPTINVNWTPQTPR
jgi:hypothetical protein